MRPRFNGLHPAGGQVGPDEWVDTFLEPAYFEQTWLQLAQVFADWIHLHNAAAAKELISLYQGVDTPGNDNGFAVYLSVHLHRSQWPLNWGVWNHDVSAVYEKAPLEAWGNAWFNAPCIFWPAPSSQRVQINGLGVSRRAPIDETLDAATPFPGSLAVRKLFPHSVLVAEPGGTSHADSLSGDKCVDGTIATYLETGKLPPRKGNAEWDKTCTPLPRPVPSPQSGSPLLAGSTGSGNGLRFGLVGADLP